MQQLKTTILSVVSRHPRRVDVKQFVTFCHKMAYAYVRSRLRSGSVNRKLIPDDVDRFALDLIADLFERDDDGRFAQLCTYFSRFDVQDADDELLLTATRRLVFSQVHDGIFNYYKSCDPSLAKIVRNLKRAVQRTDNVTLRRTGAKRWISIRSSDNRDERPVLPVNFVEERLSAWMSADPSLLSLISRLASLLVSELHFRPAYPLTSFAISVRSINIRLTVADPSEPFLGPPEKMSTIEAGEIASAVESAVHRTSQRLRISYVDRKMDADTFQNYFRAVEDALKADFIPNGESGKSRRYFLSKHLRELTSKEYNEEHRGVLDYFLRLSRDEFIDAVRNTV